MRLDNIKDDLFFTPEEIAEKLKLSVMTIYKLINQDELPYFRVGKSYRIPASSFEEYMMREGNLARFIKKAPKVPEAAKQFIQLIKKEGLEEKIFAVILFGSYARGDFNENSDIDLLVIFKEGVVEDQVSKISSKAMAACDYAEFLSPIRMTLAHWIELKESNSPLYKRVMKEGAVLWPEGLKSPADLEYDEKKRKT